MEVLFENKIGSIAQSNQQNKLFLKINSCHYAISTKEYLRIRAMLNQVDIIQAINDVSDAFDNIEISLRELKYTIATAKFTLCQFITIKDLFNGAYFAMELQDILSRKGIYMPHHHFELVAV
jgi:hypothetical protein